ncbi:MAG: 4-hydroxy-3-methylbut-2-enyl diphosphate reductase [Lentisphaerae bacterium]|nr:4-hydroxy-3-methylbut-2-enyl diphosphate reductase [Lentisphaerota bacterium]
MTTESRRVFLASPRGFCAGVRYAIEIADTALRTLLPPIYCLNEIVHNRQVVADLAERGLVFVDRVEDVPRGATLLFSAHGVSPQVRAAAEARDLDLLDATCPFVNKVHSEVRRYARDGYSVILVGHEGHDEIEGVRGEAPQHVTVVEDHHAAQSVEVADPTKVAVVTQTTLSVDETDKVMTVLRSRFPMMAAPKKSDICYATTNRQQAVAAVARNSDLVLVLGSKNSSNSRRLVEVARAHETDAHLVSAVEDLDSIALESVRALGLTAGASTPESFIDEILAALAGRGFSVVEDVMAAEEDVHFVLPARLRAEPSS